MMNSAPRPKVVRMYTSVRLSKGTDCPHCNAGLPRYYDRDAPSQFGTRFVHKGDGFVDMKREIWVVCRDPAL